ncbi:GTPase-activating protein SED4 [Nakaseomyces bracarensis]|uniref:GTPase-activating protein SED4 n=1 Tax=Nakaseomyces bracarensis TaxID=273131 RepID=UPI0038722947
MKIQTSNYDIGYPIYGARFLRKDMLLVAGGGGVGLPDVPNKLTALRINFNKKKVLKRYREITLDSSDDSPSNLDVAQSLILMGCNEGPEKINSSGQNLHLRKFVFQDEHLKFMGAIDFNGSRDPMEYTKLICISRDTTIAAIASSRVPTVIRIIDPQDMTEKYEIEVGREVRDLHFSPDGKVMAYVTPSSLEIVSVVTGRFIYRKTDFSSSWFLSRVRFINDNELVLATTITGKNSITLTRFGLQNDKVSILKSKQVFKNYKGITAMETNHDGSVIALATDDNSFALLDTKNFTILKLVPKIHTDTITRVAFSPASEYAVSVSADCNVRIYKLPSNLGKGSGFFSTLFRIIKNILMLAILVGCSYLFYINDMHITVYDFVQKKIEERKVNSTPTAVFDYNRSTTIIGDIVSVITKTEDPQTAFIDEEDDLEDLDETEDYYNQDLVDNGIHMDTGYDSNIISEYSSLEEATESIISTTEEQTQLAETATAIDLEERDIPSVEYLEKVDGSVTSLVEDNNYHQIIETPTSKKEIVDTAIEKESQILDTKAVIDGTDIKNTDEIDSVSPVINISHQTEIGTQSVHVNEDDEITTTNQNSTSTSEIQSEIATQTTASLSDDLRVPVVKPIDQSENKTPVQPGKEVTETPVEKSINETSTQNTPTQPVNTSAEIPIDSLTSELLARTDVLDGIVGQVDLEQEELQHSNETTIIEALQQEPLVSENAMSTDVVPTFANSENVTESVNTEIQPTEVKHEVQITNLDDFKPTTADIVTSNDIISELEKEMSNESQTEQKNEETSPIISTPISSTPVISSSIISSPIISSPIANTAIATDPIAPEADEIVPENNDTTTIVEQEVVNSPTPATVNLESASSIYMNPDENLADIISEVKPSTQETSQPSASAITQHQLDKTQIEGHLPHTQKQLTEPVVQQKQMPLEGSPEPVQPIAPVVEQQ